MQHIDSVLSDLPAEVVTKDKDIISSYTTDFRRQYVGATIALLRPRDRAEVQAILFEHARGTGYGSFLREATRATARRQHQARTGGNWS